MSIVFAKRKEYRKKKTSNKQFPVCVYTESKIEENSSKIKKKHRQKGTIKKKRRNKKKTTSPAPSVSIFSIATSLHGLNNKKIKSNQKYLDRVVGLFFFLDFLALALTSPKSKKRKSIRRKQKEPVLIDKLAN